MNFVNIPKNNIDPFFRYKRETIIINNSRGFTIIKNLDNISKSLERDKKQILSFLSKKLGTSTTNEKLRGNFTFQQLEELLEIYINKFILCSSCSNPETIQNEKKLTLICKACGHITKY